MEGGEGEEQSEELSVGEYFYQIYWIKLQVLSRDNDHYCVVFSRYFLQRQLWIVHYYVKSSSNNLSNKNVQAGVSRVMIFQKQFILAF